jgi:hypothetical protein
MVSYCIIRVKSNAIQGDSAAHVQTCRRSSDYIADLDNCGVVGIEGLMA